MHSKSFLQFQANRIVRLPFVIIALLLAVISGSASVTAQEVLDTVYARGRMNQVVISVCTAQTLGFLWSPAMSAAINPMHNPIPTSLHSTLDMPSILLCPGA